MLVLNAQGIVPETRKSKSAWKMEGLRDFVANQSAFIPIISITESWCKSYHSRAQINIDNYYSYRSDRKKRQRGGCIVYVHDNIIVNDFKMFDNKYCEAVQLSLPESKTLLFTIYRPPNCPPTKFQDMMSWICTQVEHVDDSWTKIINGDFNFPDIDWNLFSVSNSESCAASLIDFLVSHGLGQFVLEPTRTAYSGTSNILDLFITNDTELVLDVSSNSTMLSDHDIVKVSLNTDFHPAKRTNQYTDYSSFGMFDFKSADFGRISGYLNNVNWSELQSDDPSNFPAAFNKVVFNICQLCVPFKIASGLSNSKPKGKIKCIQGLKRRKKKLYGRIKAIEATNPGSASVASLLDQVLCIDDNIKQSILHLNAKKELSAVNNIKRNPGYFYSYVKRQSSVRSKLGPLLNENKVLISDSKEMANIFQKQFCSVFSDPSSPDLKHADYEAVPCSLHNVEFTQEDIEWAIDQLKSSSAPGMDEFPALLLKMCKHSLSLPIYLMWRNSYDNGVIDKSFLTQLIAPIFKKGSRFDSANYRPISLTSHIIKIFERVIQKKMITYLEENNLLNQNQHGFRKGFSCLSELLAHFNDVIENMSNAWRTDTIYLDFSPRHLTR